MTRETRPKILAAALLGLAAGGPGELLGQTPFDETIASGTPDFITVVPFATPTGAGPGRTTVIKFVTDATPAAIEFQLEPESAGTNGTRAPVNFTTVSPGSLTESDGVTDVVTSILALTLETCPLADPTCNVAAGHSLMTVTLQYADDYAFIEPEDWTLKIRREATTARRYFGFVGPDEPTVTRGRLVVLNDAGTLEFGNLPEGIVAAAAPVLAVELRNLGTAGITVTSTPIANNSPAFFTIEKDPFEQLGLLPGQTLENDYVDGPTQATIKGLWVMARPTALGQRVSTMTLNTDLPGEAPTVTLRTRGVSLYSHFVIDISGSMNRAPGGGYGVPETESRLWHVKQAATKVNNWIQSFTDGQAYSGLSTFPVFENVAGDTPIGGNVVVPQNRSSANHGTIDLLMQQQATGGLRANGGTPMQAGIAAARTSMVDRLSGSAPPQTGDRPNLGQVMLLLSDGDENAGSNARAEIQTLRNAGIRIFAAAYGLEGAGEVNIPLLKALSEGDAANPGGTDGRFFAVDPTDPFALKDSFKESVIEMLELSAVRDPVGTIRRGQTASHAVCLGSDAYGATFTVDWDRNAPGGIAFTLRDPRGALITPASQDVTFFQGATHATYVIRGRRMRAGQGAGQWTLELTGGNAIPTAEDTRYSYSVLAQAPQKAQTTIPPGLLTGDRFVFEVALPPIPPAWLQQLEVQLHYDAPAQSAGTFLATNRVQPEWIFGQQAAAGRTLAAAGPAVALAAGQTVQRPILENPAEPGQPLSVAELKARALAEFAGLTFPNERVTGSLQLHDDGTNGDRVAGDGIYSTNAPELTVAGVHQFLIELVTPELGRLGCFRREIPESRFIDVRLDADLMRRSTRWASIDRNTIFDPRLAEPLMQQPPEGQERRLVLFTPQDRFGNMWGPGRADEVRFELAGAEPLGPVFDNWDGSYAQAVQFPAGANPTATVVAGGVTAEAVPLRAGLALPLWAWLLIILVIVAAAVVFILVRRS